jgi:two-component SAPR family response regulator
MSAARATANFHQTLYRVRRALKVEVVVFQDGVYRLAPDLNFVYDVAEFERQSRLALGLPAGDLRRIPALRAAADLYIGEYLADLPVEWGQDRRRELHDLFVELLSEYADELIHLTRYAEARTVLSRALTVEPLRDDLHVQMLTCLGALGRRHEVVDHYHRYRELLRNELGLDPPPLARELYARLIR